MKHHISSLLTLLASACIAGHDTTPARSASTSLDSRPQRCGRAAGNSTAARVNGGAHADWYFSNGKDFDGFTEQYDDVTQIAAEHGRTVRFGLNAFAIVRDTEA